MIKLSTNNLEEFNVSIKVANQSILLKNMLEDLGDTDDNPIPLQNVSSKILQKVIEYAEHHQDDPPVTTDDTSSSDNILEWDKEFINVEQDILFDIIMAANYLDIKPLLDLGCKTGNNKLN